MADACPWNWIAMPEDEDDRITTLKMLNILGTAPEPEFDRIVEMGARAFNAPMCHVALVDEARIWFKATTGLDAEGCGRDSSFCSLTVMPHGPTIFEVPDTLLDSRFSKSPLVTGPPHIRYYAGAPLLVKGHKLGTSTSRCAALSHAPKTSP